MSHVFKRTEQKYILSTETAMSLQKMVLQGMYYSEFNRRGKKTKIRTTYLESDDFSMYQMKKRKDKKRFKIRIREYGNKRQFDNMVWIELKEKIDGEGYKSRFRVTRKKANQFLKGNDIFEHVVKDNSKIDKEYLKSLYDYIRQLIKEFELYPRFIVEYERLALQENKKGGVRLTFDSNLRGGVFKKGMKPFKKIDEPKQYDKLSSIVELKIGSIYPKEADIIKEHYSIKKKKFSKFVFAVESFFPSIISEPNRRGEYRAMNEIAVLEKEYSV